jgi:hypothetical protein
MASTSTSPAATWAPGHTTERVISASGATEASDAMTGRPLDAARLAAR